MVYEGVTRVLHGFHRCFNEVTRVTGGCHKCVTHRGQTDRGYKKPVTNTDIGIAIPLGMKRIPDSVN